jgi:hypothetical protein
MCVLSVFVVYTVRKKFTKNLPCIVYNTICSTYVNGTLILDMGGDQGI